MARSIPKARDGSLQQHTADGTSIDPIPIGTAEWFSWLEQHRSFCFEAGRMTFTARKEQRPGGWYWYAYRRSQGKLHSVYLGKSEELTLERLRAIATVLAGQAPLENLSQANPPEPGHRLSSKHSLPTGTITLLFTDIEGSTQLLQRLGERYAQVLGECRHVLRTVFAEYNGSEVDTQGDAFFAVFARATDAVAAAVAAQRAIAIHGWPEAVQVGVRMGLHTGEPERAAEGYVGLDVHHAARMMSSGHGGQVLLSQTTRDLVEHDLPEGVSVRDLGAHHLKDLEHPSHLFQLVIAGLPADFPPLKTLDVHPNNLPVQLTPLIGREQDVASAVSLLRRPEVRLLTMIGTAGIGKTRLALQVAVDLLEDFVDGVYFVSLAPISDPNLVLTTIAQTLGLRVIGNESIAESLSAFLQKKHFLLVLDSFEQVMAAASQLVELLIASPELKLLVTSREILHLRVEQRLFRRLAVFVGGCTLEAVEAVCCALDDAETAHGEAESVRQAHAACYLRLAEEAEHGLVSPEQEQWLERLEREHENLRATLAWLIEQGELETALCFATALWRFWSLHGHHREGYSILQHLLNATGTSAVELRAKALIGAGVLTGELGQHVQAETLCKEGLQLFRELEDRQGMILSLWALGKIIDKKNQYATARTWAEEALAEELLRRSKQAGNSRGVTVALFSMGAASCMVGNLVRGQALLTECLVQTRATGNVLLSAYTLFMLGFVACFQGEYTTASDLIEEGMMYAQKVGDREAYWWWHFGRALVAFGQGNYPEARMQLGKCLTILSQWEYSYPLCVTWSLDRLGEVTAALGEPLWAARLWGAAQMISLLYLQSSAAAMSNTLRSCVTNSARRHSRRRWLRDGR
jgi:class 3 adenylate cyclase/tetratricopeptide (TPR) repeat protein